MTHAVQSERGPSPGTGRCVEYGDEGEEEKGTLDQHASETGGIAPLHQCTQTVGAQGIPVDEGLFHGGIIAAWPRLWSVLRAALPLLPDYGDL